MESALLQAEMQGQRPMEGDDMDHDFEADIMEAEMQERAMQEGGYTDDEDLAIPLELVPPSSPPARPIHTRPPARPSAPLHQRAQAAIAELEDIPMEAFFDSPPPAQQAQRAKPLPPRTEASASRAMRGPGPSSPVAPIGMSSQALAGPGPSSSAARARRQAVLAGPAPAVVKPDIKHPWTKEVEQKLRQVFGLPKFRLHQKEAIDETMAGKDGELWVPVFRDGAHADGNSIRADAYWRREKSDM